MDKTVLEYVRVVSHALLVVDVLVQATVLEIIRNLVGHQDVVWLVGLLHQVIIIPSSRFPSTSCIGIPKHPKRVFEQGNCSGGVISHQRVPPLRAAPDISCMNSK